MGKKLIKFDEIESEEQLNALNLTEEQKKELMEKEQVEIDEPATPPETPPAPPAPSDGGSADGTPPAPEVSGAPAPAEGQSAAGNQELEPEKKEGADKSTAGQQAPVETVETLKHRLEEREKEFDREKRGLIGDLSETRKTLKELRSRVAPAPAGGVTLSDDDDPVKKVIAELQANPADLTNNEAVIRLANAFEERARLQSSKQQQSSEAEEEIAIANQMKSSADKFRETHTDYDEVIKNLPRLINESPGYWHAIREEARAGGDSAALAYEFINRKFKTAPTGGSPGSSGQPATGTQKPHIPPERPPIKTLRSGGGATGAGNVLTLEKVANMSPEDFAALREKNPELVSKLLNGG